MEVAGGEAVKLHDGVLGVPRGGGVGGGDHHAAVGGAGGQPEAKTQARRGIQQAVVKLLPDGFQQGG